MHGHHLLVPVVEGHGEDAAVPVLVRRLLHAAGDYETVVARPFRTKRNAVVRPGELERAVRTAVTLRTGDTVDARVLVILDADDDCPVELATDLGARARRVLNCPVQVVIADREAEAWLLADVDGLGSKLGAVVQTSAPNDVDSVRGAKEWLRRHVLTASPYSPTQDQAKWFALIDLETAKSHSRSLRRLDRAILQLTTQPS